MTSRSRPALLLLACVATLAAPLAAKDSLGVFSGWAAFRDAQVPRCYAIAKPEPTGPQAMRARDYEPYASVATWPTRQVRGQRIAAEIYDAAKLAERHAHRGGCLFDHIAIDDIEARLGCLQHGGCNLEGGLLRGKPRL